MPSEEHRFLDSPLDETFQVLEVNLERLPDWERTVRQALATP